MSETQVQTSGDGNPQRTATGEIIDQSPVTSGGTTSATTQTLTSGGTTSSTTSATSSPADDKSLLNKDAKPAAAPEKYEPFTVPDGYTLDEAVATEAGTLFKSLNLSQEAGQKLIDMYVAKTTEAFQQPYKAYRDMREGWVKEAKAHAEIGANLDQVKLTIGKALDGLGDAALANDFRAAMDLTGAGDHPAFIRTFYKLAQLVTEGKQVSGNGPSVHGQRQPGKPVDAAHALYPNNA